MNIVVLSGSRRKGGNTDVLVKRLLKVLLKSIMWKLYLFVIIILIHV